jgi:hypothetical protein
MARTRTKRPPTLGLNVTVLHPESMDFGHPPQGVSAREHHERNVANWPVDRDGHHIGYAMDAIRDQALLRLTIQHGVSAQEAARLLRKVAHLVERNPELLTIRQGYEGTVRTDSTLGKCPLSLDDCYDDFGQLNAPEIFPLPEEQEPPV